MGPFGASHYSLSYFIPFHPKLPQADATGGVRPEAVSLSDAWKGLGLTYFLLKGLKKTSKTLKLLTESGDGHAKKDAPPATASSSSKGAVRSLRNPVSTRPVTSQNTAGYGLRKLSRSKSQSKACKSDTLGIEQKEVFSGSEPMLHEAATRGDLRFRTERSFREFGLGIEGVMTTITGLSQQVHYKNEVKEMITVVKTADRVVQGVKAANGVLQTFSSPLGDALLALGAGGNGVVLGMNTVKIVLKGVKISKGFITVTKLCRNKQTGAIGVGAEMVIKSNQNMLGQRFKVIVKGLKASEGAANVVSISKEVGKTLGMLDKAELLSWNVIIKGFKFTKSALRVLEPVGSLPSAIGKGILETKGAVEGIGVVVKAVVLSQELYILLLKVGGFTKGATAALNEFKRRSSLAKRTKVLQQPSEFSKRTEVSFKELHPCHVMPAAISCESVTDPPEYYRIHSSFFSDFYRQADDCCCPLPVFSILTLADIIS